MPNEPLLTRKSYKEQLEKQNRELEELEVRQERRDSRGRAFEQEEQLYTEREEESQQVQRTPKSGLRKYNHFLNVWIGVATIFLIIIFLIQYFF